MTPDLLSTVRTNLDKIDWKLTKPEVRLRKTLLFQNFVQIETSVLRLKQFRTH